MGVQSNTGGWQGSYHPTGVPHTRDDRWSGPEWDFVTQAATEGGFYINITAPPPIVTRLANLGNGGTDAGSFWDCTYATAMGYLDMCIGMHTVTPERLWMSPFFIVQLNAMYLVVPAASGQSMSGLINKTFAPIESTLWGALVAVIVIMSGIITLQERHHHRKDGAKGEPQDWAERNIDRAPTLLEHLRGNLITNTRALYDAGVGHSSTGAARISQLGFGFFVLLFIASYTANLTTFLVQSANIGTVKDFTAAKQRGMSFCGSRMGTETARQLHPDANWVRDPADGKLGIISQRNVLNYIGQYCDAAVMDKQDLAAAHGDGDHCDRLCVGDPIVYETVGMPLSAVGTIARQLSQVFAAQTKKGAWERAKDASRKPDLCVYRRASTQIKLGARSSRAGWCIPSPPHPTCRLVSRRRGSRRSVPLAWHVRRPRRNNLPFRAAQMQTLGAKEELVSDRWRPTAHSMCKAQCTSWVSNLPLPPEKTPAHTPQCITSGQLYGDSPSGTEGRTVCHMQGRINRR